MCTETSLLLRDLEEDVFHVGLQFHPDIHLQLSSINTTHAHSLLWGGPFILSWAIHISGTQPCQQTVGESGSGPDQNLSLQTETAETKSLHCVIPLSADNLGLRSVENVGEVMSCPTLLGWVFQLCPPSTTHLGCHSSPACPLCLPLSWLWHLISGSAAMDISAVCVF